MATKQRTATGSNPVAVFSGGHGKGMMRQTAGMPKMAWLENKNGHGMESVRGRGVQTLCSTDAAQVRQHL